MIEARNPLQDIKYYTSTTKLPVLHWRSDWDGADGYGTTIGLIDSGFAANHPDLKDANITVRNFVDGFKDESCYTEHATYSVTTLVGQGVFQILGIVPRSKVLMAIVVGQDNRAQSGDVTRALTWLIESEVNLIAIPLGDAVAYPNIKSAIDYAKQKGIPVFAAAGNSYPGQILFPARDTSTIAVGAIDSNGQLLYSCCRFPQLDIVAPGSDIVGAISYNRIKPCSGSSVACILVAGAASLAISLDPTLVVPVVPSSPQCLLIRLIER